MQSVGGIWILTDYAKLPRSGSVCYSDVSQQISSQQGPPTWDSQVHPPVYSPQRLPTTAPVIQTTQPNMAKLLRNQELQS